MVPRFLPSDPLPAVTYVPGGPAPRPDAGDERRLSTDPPAERFEPSVWRSSREFLRGADLFNQGFYWEAHEAWEALWHRAGRRGLTADFLKGLIKLAAAGVKAYEGREAGVRRHARRALELWAPHRASGDETWAALGVGDLSRYAEQAIEAAAELAGVQQAAPVAGLLGSYLPRDPD